MCWYFFLHINSGEAEIGKNLMTVRNYLVSLLNLLSNGRHMQESICEYVVKTTKPIKYFSFCNLSECIFPELNKGNVRLKDQRRRKEMELFVFKY